MTNLITLINLQLMRVANAADVVPTTAVNPLKSFFVPGTVTIAVMIAVVLNIAIGASLAIAILMSVMAAIKYATSQGEDKATKAAKDALQNAIISIAISLSAVTVKMALSNVLNANTAELNAISPF